jgi:hypothetical protein
MNQVKKYIKANTFKNSSKSVKNAFFEKILRGPIALLKHRLTFAPRFDNAAANKLKRWVLVTRRPIRLAVRTSPFHGGNTGSIPVSVTNNHNSCCTKSPEYVVIQGFSVSLAFGILHALPPNFVKRSRIPNQRPSAHQLLIPITKQVPGRPGIISFI